MKTVVSLFLLLSLALPSLAQETAVIGGHLNRPPLDWQVGDTSLTGAAIELITQVLNDLGVPLETQVAPWARMLHQLQTGDIDLAVGVYKNEDRQVFASFTESFFLDRVSVFVWQDRSFPFNSMDDLEGKRFGEILGATRGKEFDQWLMANATVQYVSDHQSTFRMLEANRIDCFVFSHLPGLIRIKQAGLEGRIVPLEQAISEKPLYFAISKQSPLKDRLPEINTLLRKRLAQGEWETLVAKHTAAYIDTHPSPQQ
ncbi:MAG: transporter substrate-binding domain-containing protein [Proteobacteria bacterium]|nr:transporter substrate-binding domain-containing protein [Pseudomonadota bacterium]MBU1611690.1 transporter substrate-binding domain-containing protein [Pseudomonadota bacterium]